MIDQALAVILHDERQRRIEATLERRGIMDRAREAESETRRPRGRSRPPGARSLPQDATGPAL
jgi:hypothetical protein